MPHNPIPEQGYLRIRQIIGDPKRGIPPLVPISERGWWAGVKAGKYPASIKLTPGVTVWRADDVRQLLSQEPTMRRAELAECELEALREHAADLGLRVTVQTDTSGECLIGLDRHLVATLDEARAHVAALMAQNSKGAELVRWMQTPGRVEAFAAAVDADFAEAERVEEERAARKAALPAQRAPIDEALAIFDRTFVAL